MVTSVRPLFDPGTRVRMLGRPADATSFVGTVVQTSTSMKATGDPRLIAVWWDGEDEIDYVAENRLEVLPG